MNRPADLGVPKTPADVTPYEVMTQSLSALIKHQEPCGIIQMHQQLWHEKLFSLIIYVSHYSWDAHSVSNHLGTVI